jgi:uncharacterized membrane protein
MFGSEFLGFPFCWLFPILMIALCLFMIKGPRRAMMCGFGSRDKDSKHISASDSVMDILGKRYAQGEINREEYEEKKETLSRHK